jgi:DNA-directed RNA polymerase subunit H (RpoH/RPB5)
VSEEEDVIDIFSKLASCDENLILIVEGDRKRFLPELLRSVDEDQYRKFFFINEARALSAGHELVPWHRLATDEELEKLKQKRIPFETLPRIGKEDAVVRWHGWKKGDILAIERSEGMYFRIVN